MKRAFTYALSAAIAVCGCAGDGTPITGLSTFHVVITEVNGADPPTEAHPLPANRGETLDTWAFTIEARQPDGSIEPFNGLVRLSSRPGAVLGVSGPDAEGRNVRIKDGRASGAATVTAVYGPARLWVEDIGYTPAKVGDEPACSNGTNDDGEEDVLVDYPADPGCAFADDESEAGGTFAAGVSQPVQYELPSLVDIQGESSTTPYPFESIEVATKSPHELIVTRVSSEGFFATDLSAKDGYGHLFAFNFSTPSDMRVCDRLTYLAGTVNEFFGFTELSFPSFQVEFPVFGDPCKVPDAALIPPTSIGDAEFMEKIESGFVVVKGFSMPKLFGSKLVVNNAPKPDASNCDLNGDGVVDFEAKDEGGCSKACESEPTCSEWNAFTSRQNIKVSNGASVIQVNLSTVTAFDPRSVLNKGKMLKSVSGTLRNFSGGTLNWTVETRCPDDLVCDGVGCAPVAVPADKACIELRTIDDNDEGTN